MTETPHEQITEDQVRPLPAALARLIRAAVQEYEAGQLGRIGPAGAVP